METRDQKYYQHLLNNFFELYVLKLNKKKVLRYWPIIKIQAGYFLSLQNDNKINQQKLKNKLEFIKQKISFSDLKYLIITFCKLLQNQFKNKNKLKNKVLLFGFSEHYYKQNDQFVNLYLSPFKTELLNRKICFEELLISNTENNS